MATIDDFRAAAERVRNWGRWGDDDQLGTLNLITPDAVARAAGLVHRGAVFALGTAFDADGVWPGDFIRRNPQHLMVVDGGDEDALHRHLPGYGGTQEAKLAAAFGGLLRFNEDMVIMPLQCASQWDALAHVYYDGELYNGVPAAAVTSLGATRNSIDKVDVKGIAARGVLLDVARFRGASHVPPNDAIESDELAAVARAQRVAIRPGDVLLIRTGWWGQLAAVGDADAWRAGCPGLSWTCATWLHEHDIAAVAADNVAVEASRMDVDGVGLPLHLLCLRDMGMIFGELWDLDLLAADCASDGVYEFLLVAPPLRITGAVGSPVNPLAMK